MSQSHPDDFGPGLELLLLPAGLLFIALVVAGLFMTVHDTPDTNSPSAAVSSQTTD